VCAPDDSQLGQIAVARQLQSPPVPVARTPEGSGVLAALSLSLSLSLARSELGARVRRRALGGGAVPRAPPLEQPALNV